MRRLKNFGHTNYNKFDGVGINAKNSEFHAAMGLCNLKYIHRILDQRKQLSLWYNKYIVDLNIERPVIVNPKNYNYAYYPILLESELELFIVMNFLERYNVYPRRYFYPCLSNLGHVSNTPNPIAENIASRILCLPLYHTLQKSKIQFISELLSKILERRILKVS